MGAGREPGRPKRTGAMRTALLAATVLVLAGAAVLAGKTAATFSDQASVPDNTFSTASCFPTWWDASYGFRQRLTVTTGAAAVPNGYSVPLSFDHSALVSASPSKSLSSGDDVRVLHWDAGGCAWTELDRVLQEESTWNSATTAIWFALQADILASSGDGNYYLYYGNLGAGSPPANKSNVYQFWDDFDDAVLDAGWSLDAIGSVSGGSTSESGTVVRVTATSTGDIWGASDSAYHLARSISGNFLAESYTTAVGGTHHVWSKYGGVHLRDTSSANSKNRNMSEVYSFAGSTNSYRLATGGSTAEQLGQRYDYNRVTRIGGTSRAFNSSDGIVWNEIGSAISFTGGLPDPVRIGPILAAISSSDHWVEVDWFKVRLYVEPEPTISLGGEESAP